MARRDGCSRAAWLVPALALLGSACVLPDQLSELQKDVADIRQQMQAVRKDQSDSQAKLTAMEEKLASGGEVKRTEFADLKLQIDQMQRDFGALDDRANETQRRMDRMSQELSRRDATRRAPESAAAPPQPGATDTPTAPGAALPSTAIPSPEALYNQAYADFSRGNYALAVSGFEEYASRFPDSALAGSALYWIGECRYAEGSFDRAIEAFDHMLERYPDSDKAAAANLKKGLAYLEQNDVRLAIVQLRYVTTTYPASDEARIARDKLASLGAGPEPRGP